jgi:hypothetical protein
MSPREVMLCPHTLLLMTCEKINLTNNAPSADFSLEICVKDSMDNYFNLVSGWLKVSGNSLLDSLPSGSGICRVVPVEPSKYWTGYVSTAGGSFKQQDENGNWYGTSLAYPSGKDHQLVRRFTSIRT